MGVAIFIVAERELPGLDMFVNGKALGRSRQLDRLAKRVGVRPLADYFSISPEEAAATIEEFGGHQPEGGFPPVRWFPAADGLETVRGLLAHLAHDPAAIPDAVAVVDDLREVERVLTALAEAGVGWHSAVDY